MHKSKYNNNNNSVVAVCGGAGSAGSVGGVGGSGMPPKTILQNPNRVLKTRQHTSSAAINVEVSTLRPSLGLDETNKAAKNGSNIGSGSANNVVNTTESQKGEVVANNVATAVAESTARHESLQFVQSTSQTNGKWNN